MTRTRNLQRGQLLNTIGAMVRYMAETPDHEFTSEAFPLDVSRATNETERGFGNHYVRSVVVPLGYFARDLTLASPTSGGALTGDPRLMHTPFPRGFSVMADAGVRIMTPAVGESWPGIPFVQNPAVPSWIANEGDPVPESEMTFGLRDVTGKTMGFNFRLSRRLQRNVGQAGNGLIAEDSMRRMGVGIDAAILGGTGGSGQPLGLLFTPGLFEQAGASLGWSGIQAMQKAVLDAGSAESAIRWVGATNVRQLLAARERAAGSGFIWADRQIDGGPAAAAREAPAGTLFCGDFSSVVVTMSAVTVLVDNRRVTNGSSLVVLLVDADVSVLYPAMLARATSVT
jgi:hypothetical protein